MPTAADLDAADPLASCRERFIDAETSLVYFDGNSLGRPLKATADRLHRFVTEEWGGRLIRGWEESWFALPVQLGDRLGEVLLGAAPGQTVIGDSTSVLIYKLMRAAVALRPDRTEIVLDSDNFPTDRYLADGVARECGLSLRWIEVDRAVGVEVDQVAEVVGDQTALVLLSQVAYRSGWLADAARITEVAHDAGALVLWDLCHSAGSVPIELDAWEVDLAVGCTYKYLNGGPGSPAFGYVASRLLDDFRQPIQGWIGSRDPFLMGPDYRPAPGIRALLSGTPAVIGMLGLVDMVELIDEVGIDQVRAKSVLLTEHAISIAEDLLAPFDVEIASPRDASRRGGHVTLQHPMMREINTRLWREDVLPDYRDPGGLRLGLSPLSTSYDEVDRGLEAIRRALTEVSSHHLSR